MSIDKRAPTSGEHLPTRNNATPADASETSVIIACYNQWPWLRLVLEGLRHQTAKGFETILADDGSNLQTIGEINSYMAQHPELNIKHVWHPDNGWQKNICLNRAIAASSGKYLCFLDADCIPSPKWLEDHLKLQRPHTIIAGRRATFSPEISNGMEQLTHLDANWYRNMRRRFLATYFSFPPHTHLLRIIRLPIVHGKGWLQRPTGNLIGCNFSMYRADLLALNGFDERYLGPGLGEDIDLAWRARFNGYTIEKVPHQAMVLHRNHPTSTFSVTSKTDNNKILEETKRNKTIYTPYGLNK